MADSDQSALICWVQLPTDSSSRVTRPACNPRVNEQAREIDKGLKHAIPVGSDMNLADNLVCNLRRS
jgi:hypothetical protein